MNDKLFFVGERDYRAGGYYLNPYVQVNDDISCVMKVFVNTKEDKPRRIVEWVRLYTPMEDLFKCMSLVIQESNNET